MRFVDAVARPCCRRESLLPRLAESVPPDVPLASLSEVSTEMAAGRGNVGAAWCLHLTPCAETGCLQGSFVVVVGTPQVKAGLLAGPCDVATCWIGAPLLWPPAARGGIGGAKVNAGSRLRDDERAMSSRVGTSPQSCLLNASHRRERTLQLYVALNAMDVSRSQRTSVTGFGTGAM